MSKKITITRKNQNGTTTTYQRKLRGDGRRTAKDEKRVYVREGPAAAMDIDAYANILLDFREWCIANNKTFRVEMIAAVREHRKRLEAPKIKNFSEFKNFLVQAAGVEAAARLNVGYCPICGNSNPECKCQNRHTTNLDAHGFSRSAILCGHANECGVNCDCYVNCYCKAPGNTCGRNPR